MKAQKLGLVLGMNMAVACMVLQGCKADKAPKTDLPPSTTVMTVAPADSGDVATTPSLAPTATAPTATAPTAVPSGVMIEQPSAQPAPVVAQPTATAPKPLPPSNVRTVKPLPPVGKPVPPPKKPVVTSTPAGGAPTATAPAAPAAAATGFVYTVKPGDQLFAVTRRYNVRMDAVKKANPGLNPNKIRVGQKITIPGVAAPTATAATTAPATAGSTTMQASAPAPTVTAANPVPPVKTKTAFKPYEGPTKEYKVQPGDTLGKIAVDNGISTRALKELNKMTKDSVRAGSKILIPAEKVVATKTTVDKKAPVAKSAATKAADAKQTEAKAEKKDAAAEVKPVEKKEEPKVEAPVEKKEEPKAEAPVVEAPAAPAAAPVAPAAAPAAAPAGNTYTVKEGDDLVSVSITCGVSPSQLLDFNGLKPDATIKPGQVLKLPAGANKQNAE